MDFGTTTNAKGPRAESECFHSFFKLRGGGGGGSTTLLAEPLLSVFLADRRRYKEHVRTARKGSVCRVGVYIWLGIHDRFSAIISFTF